MKSFLALAYPLTYKYILFHKPYGVLCQFTGEEGDRTLSDFQLPKGVYAAGRLDKDSEGLLLLTDDGVLNQRITDPKSHKEKTYWAQVEGEPTIDMLKEFCSGVVIKGYKTKPAKAKVLEGFSYPARTPPIRERKHIPTTWLEIKLTEGKNRQVRRMCAAVGMPCLRLIRVGIGKASLGELKVGQWKEVSQKDLL